MKKYFMKNLVVQNGSITPFCALSLMLVASLLFALLESARLSGLERYVTLKTETVMDSVCAEYQPYLWQEYGLLFLDGAYGTEQFSMGYVIEQLENHMDANCNTTDGLEKWLGLDLFQLKRNEVLLEGYALATDDNGELFLNYVAERAKENLPLGMAEDIYEQYQRAERLEEEHSGVEKSIEKAQAVIGEVKSAWLARQMKDEEEVEKLKKAEDEKETGQSASAIIMPDTSALDNTLNCAVQMKGSGILNMVFADTSGISAKESLPKSNLQSRKKEEGTLYLKTDKVWYQKLLVLSYMEEYFGNYAKVQKDHFLNYEMEYVACGKSTEWKNLEGALNRMLLMREAANVAYLLGDEEKMALAEGVAGLIGLLAGENPAVVKVVQTGIIGAWAYMESVLDVRTLVAGGVIPLLKQKEEWTSSITNLFAVFDKNTKAKECKNGLNYTDYLKQILFLTDNQKLAYRMMEVMEIGLQGQEKYINCRMDYMIAMLRFKISFLSVPVFSSLVSVGNVYQGDYVFAREAERSYIP